METLTNALPFGSTGSFLVLFLGGVLVLYVARTAAHSGIKHLFGALSSGLRLSARTLQITGKKLRERNREVLLELGKEQVSRELEKEFFEISKFVQRDLGGYPQLQRQIQETITSIQEDYSKCGEVPPQAPDWLEAIDALTHMKNSGQAAELNSKLLDQIHSAAQKQHKQVLQANREEATRRHKILKKMTPYWRKLSNSIGEVGTTLQEIIERSNKIDTHMNRFDEIVNGTDRAYSSLKASSLTQFAIALIVVIVAIGGAFFNFHLIALPMSEMVGSVHRIGGVKVADLAALVIICLEATAGIFLLESLRITKLFPMIGSMDDRMRRIIMVASAVILVVLACTESALAFMRDQIAADLAALRSSLAGSEITATQGELNTWIPMAANMILGFILPLALTMVAIPLEYLLQTGRTVLGGVLEILLSCISVALRILASCTRHLGKIIISLYDVLVAGPLWIESMIKSRESRSSTSLESTGFFNNK